MRRKEKSLTAEDKRDLEGFKEYLESRFSYASTKTYMRTLTDALKNYKENPEELLLKKSLSNSSRHTYHAALRKWAEYKEDERLKKALASEALKREMKNLLREEHRTHAKHLVQPFPTDQEKRLFAVLKEWRENDDLPSWQWPAISMMCKLGLRAGVDLAWLARKDIDSAVKNKERLSIVTKGSKERELPAVLVMDEMKRLLSIKEKWEILADLIVTYEGGDTHQKVGNAYERIRGMTKRLAKEADIPVKDMHPHRLRHTAAQRLYAITKDIRKVQQFLGHESFNTTLGYLQKNLTQDIGEDLMAAIKELEGEKE